MSEDMKAPLPVWFNGHYGMDQTIAGWAFMF